MLVFNSIWAAYGIKTTPDETIEMRSLSSHIKRSDAPQPSLVIDASSEPSHPAPLVILPASEQPKPPTPDRPATLFDPAFPVAPPAASTTLPSSALSTSAIAGICIGTGIFIFLLAFVVLEICVLRKRRRDRALRRVAREAERGARRSGSVGGEGMGMEFVVEKDGVEIVEENEVEGGRKGMSLPRRMW